MWKKVALVTATIAAAAFAVMIYPVGGVVWSARQVDRLAEVNGDLRSETSSEAAIKEALGGVRVDRFRRMIRLMSGRECHPRMLEFHTQTGWVSAIVQCPSGFYLDFIAPPHP